MIDKTSHYEYLATNVDDILIWSKDPMAVIKSLEKIYLLKNVGIPEYYLGGNVEFLGDSWKNQSLGLAISARTYWLSDVKYTQCLGFNSYILVILLASGIIYLALFDKVR